MVEKTKRQRRKRRVHAYTKEEKLNAVRLAAEIGVSGASRRLGVNTSLLYKWRRDPRLVGLVTDKRGARVTTFPPPDQNRIASPPKERIALLRSEVYQLRKENELLREKLLQLILKG